MVKRPWTKGKIVVEQPRTTIDDANGRTAMSKGRNGWTAMNIPCDTIESIGHDRAKQYERHERAAGQDRAGGCAARPGRWTHRDDPDGTILSPG